MSIQAEDLLYRHTIFPYSTARMGRNETDRLAKNIIELGGKSIVVLVQSASVGKGAPRYCRSCIIEDLRQRGESYWHRQHNVPFIQRCNIHGELLLAIPAKKSAAFTVTRLPEECEGLLVRELLPESISSVLMQLSIDCLENLDRREELDWRRGYRQLAEMKGFPRQGTGLSSLSVLSAFQQFYGDELLESAGLNYPPTEFNAWPVLLLRSGFEIATTTARHLLMQVFLEFSDSPALIPSATQPGRKPRDIARTDELLAQKVQEVIASLSTGTRITVTELLKHAGGWGVFKHRRLEMPRTNQLVLDFRLTDFSERQAGRRPYWRKRLGLEK